MKKFSISKILWVLLGIVSVVWFLIRVIPKPSRATYPCQRAAFPIASAFVIWLISLVLSVKLFVKARYLFRTNRIALGVLFMILATFAYFSGRTYQPIMAGISYVSSFTKDFTPIDPPNSPMGTSFGIFPGRVVWYHNAEATSWDGSNGRYWDDSNTNINEVNQMFSETIDAITGATSNWDSWRMLFEDFNQRKGNGEQGYQEGEKIAIKLNLSNSGTHGPILHNRSMASPIVVLTLVRQLVYEAEVPDTCITLYDVSDMIPSNIYNEVKDEFPGVQFVDKVGGSGRELYETDYNAPVAWSEDLVLEVGGGNPTYLPVSVSEASYIINLGHLKGHGMAGITLCGKNHVGTLISTNPDNPNLSSPRSAGIHPYATVHYFGYWDLEERPMGSYNTFVDLMGHEHLGNKTLLFIVDGLYASVSQNGNGSIPNKWFMPPFNNDWTSSIFMSQDNVALESVCLDFLRNEPTQEHVYGSVDNYLHEAAQANDPPSGTFYDPEGDGTAIQSLGVHEHWNNEDDMMYTGNTNPGEGIELIKMGNYAVEALSFSIPPGEYFDSVTVELSTPTPLTDIYYTLDGSYPDENTILYTGSITLKETTTINARAMRQYYEPSEIITGTFAVQSTVSTQDLEKESMLVFPTIADQWLYVKNIGSFTTAEIMIYDINGRMVLQKNSVGEQNAINIAGLTKGVYFVKIVSGNQSVTRRFIRK